MNDKRSKKGKYDIPFIAYTVLFLREYKYLPAKNTGRH
jgi:hypothetical protein